MQRKCPKCGHIENEYTFFCTECGAKTEEYCVAGVYNNMANELVSDKSEDESVISSLQEVHKTNDIVRNRKKWLCLASGLAGIVVIVLSVVLLNSKSEKSTVVNAEPEIIDSDTAINADTGNDRQEAPKQFAEVDDLPVQESPLNEDNIQNADGLLTVNESEEDFDAVESDRAVNDSGFMSFYGIWCGAAKDETKAQQLADELRGYGFDAQVFVSTDWDNLNDEKWYVVSAGVYSSEDEANADLPNVQAVNNAAYVKYSGNHK